jgi:hypothetical protein
MSVETQHIIRRRNKKEEYQTLSGVSAIQLSITNLTMNPLRVDLFGNSNNRKKIMYDEIIIKNNTHGYEDDDNNFTMLRNYINAVGYFEIITFKFQSTNPSQLQQSFTETQFEKGILYPKNHYTAHYMSAYAFQSTIVDIPKNITLKKDTILTF